MTYAVVRELVMVERVGLAERDAALVTQTRLLDAVEAQLVSTNRQQQVKHHCLHCFVNLHVYLGVQLV